MPDNFKTYLKFVKGDVEPLVWWDDGIRESCIRPQDISIKAGDITADENWVVFEMTSRDGHHIAFVCSTEHARGIESKLHEINEKMAAAHQAKDEAG